MAFFKQIFTNKSVRAVFNFLKNKYLIATIIFLAIICFIDTNNIFSLYKDLKDVSSQERQKEYYRKAIEETQENLLELTSNRDSLEKFAREQFLFHQADEDVFVVKEK